MQRITHPTAAPDLFGPGKNGYTEGTPGLDNATVVTANWLNGVQEELARVIETAGITLDSNNRGQLLAALTSYIAPLATTSVAGKVELATTAETAAGTDAVRAVTPATLLAGRGMRDSQTFSAVGSSNFTVPAGITSVLVEAWGGGGGGAMTLSGGNCYGGGGGGGGYGSGFYTVTPGQVILVTVGGTGTGAATASANGNAGGTSSFGSLLSVTGGAGGEPGGISVAGIPGAGGESTGGTILNLNGQRGSYGGRNTDSLGAGGGDAPRGGGGAQPTTGSGRTGVAPGGGGGSAGTSATAAGTGAPGMVVVYW